MSNLPCTTVAGRHAADARRSRAHGALLERQDAAREQLAHELRSYGLTTYPHANYEMFVKARVRGIAAGLNVAAHNLSGDMTDVNYSSARIAELSEREVWVECRVLSCAQDRAFVYAILDELHWTPDCTRLSRFRQSYEVVRLRHADTGAAVVLIVKMPATAPEPLEAA